MAVDNPTKSLLRVQEGGDWFATFCGDSPHADKYVRIPITGTSPYCYQSARACMFDMYGTKWAFIYNVNDPSSGLEIQMLKYGLTELPWGERIE